METAWSQWASPYVTTTNAATTYTSQMAANAMFNSNRPLVSGVVDADGPVSAQGVVGSPVQSLESNVFPDGHVDHDDDIPF